MNEKNYKWLVYLIGITIVLTISVQIYWNFKNYEIEKKRLADQLEQALDHSLEKYYASIAKQEISNITTDSLHFFDKGAQHDIDIILEEDSLLHGRKIKLKHKGITDSLGGKVKYDIHTFKSATSSFNGFPVNKLISKVFVSYISDSIKLKEIASILDSELSIKNIEVPYLLKYKFGELGTKSMEQTYGNRLIDSTSPQITSSSLWLGPGSEFSLLYSNKLLVLLRRISTSLILSLLLSLLIIACLIFLLRTISRQKKLSKIKNDLISNISHEFKTPIATIGVAIESLQDFNMDKDPVKKDHYLNISKEQLGKLTYMIENLLESSKLSGKELQLNYQETDIRIVLMAIKQKTEVISPIHNVILNLPEEVLTIKVDAVLFENALMNLIDNAIKYGGEDIHLSANQLNNLIILELWDNGVGIPKEHQKLIFEQFYRIPSGNIHNTKGYGLGLYHSKKIIEAHSGSILLINTKEGQSKFIIKLPLYVKN